MSKGLIKSISDHYCDPAATELIEMSGLVSAQHVKNNVVPLVLSARASGRNKRRLAASANKADVFLDPTLTVTQLADHVDCSIMHLFHVLKEDKKTSFVDFGNECRTRYATTLLLDGASSNIHFDHVAEKADFGFTSEFCDAFDPTFGDGPEAHMEHFGR
jgi:AraC-like DNA-binding protein